MNTIQLQFLAVAAALAWTTPSAAQLASVAAVNAATFEAAFPVSPGCWTTAFGDFASQGVSTTFADSVPFPTMLGGVQALVNDVAAAMNFVGGGQINFLVPPQTQTGRATLRITVSGLEIYSGKLDVIPVSPGLLSINPADPTRPAAALNQDGTLNGPDNPARRGEVIQLFGVGADFSELPDAGAPAPTDRLIPTASPTTLHVSVAEAAVAFSGLAPGLVNAWQINAVVPDLPFIRGQVPVRAVVRGVSTNLVSIWVAD